MLNTVIAGTSSSNAFGAQIASATLCRKDGGMPVAALNGIGTVARFARNATIFSENDAARFSYKVVKGAVRLSKVMLDGRRQIAQFLLPGDLFALDCGEEYPLTAEALTEVTLVCYPRAHIERLSDDVPEVRRALMLSLRRELSAAQHHLMMLGRQTAKERMASFLLLMAKRPGVEDRNRVEFPMGRQDIADYLGLTIETVCRALTELKKSGVVSLPDRHQAVIRNFEALETIAAGGA
jgi:CRP-like cAMP-binding protein